MINIDDMTFSDLFNMYGSYVNNFRDSTNHLRFIIEQYQTSYKTLLKDYEDVKSHRDNLRRDCGFKDQAIAMLNQQIRELELNSTRKILDKHKKEIKKK